MSYPDEPSILAPQGREAGNAQTLYQRLLHLDRRNYKAYREIQGQYDFPHFTLAIDHVQGDPFAAPSRLRIFVPQSQARFPASLYHTQSRRVALCDYLTRQFHRQTQQLSGKRGSGKSGLIAITDPGQQVLERSAVWIDDRHVEVRFVVGLPAQGRTILGQQAVELFKHLPDLVERSLRFACLHQDAIRQQVETVEDADWLRSQLADRGLVAFIPDGAMLPRQSGVDDRPLAAGLPFQSPDSLRVSFDRPNQGQITGMGIPKGVTLIVGGGYHGKSTLLRAITTGVYNHIPGDGREQVVTDANAVKIRAEDGRSVVGVNISPFINHLPQGRSTICFSTENASGSTSQAATIMEALELGATTLLVDEDTSATNFMIRDQRMQALIAKEQEPITPFIDKIRQLYEDYDVSIILVMGGSGDYFDVADTVIAMTEFEPEEVTAQAKQIAQRYATQRITEGGTQFGTVTPRIPLPTCRDARQTEAAPRSRPPKLKVRDVDELVVGQTTIDLSAVEQIVDVSQLRAIGAAISYLQQHYLDGQRCLADSIECVMADLGAGSLDILTPYPQGDLANFRPHELAAALNRLRALQVQ